jgi:hypothetical protein
MSASARRKIAGGTAGTVGEGEGGEEEGGVEKRNGLL